MKLIEKRAISILLIAALIVTAIPSVLASSGTKTTVTAPEGKVLVAQTDYTLASGVTETHVVLNDATGNAQNVGYLTAVAKDAKVTFKASYGGYYTDGSTKESRAEAAKTLKCDLASTTKQAAAFEAATGLNVISATNADYFNMQTGQALGCLIMEGNAVTSAAAFNEPYFAVLKDGSYVIREQNVPYDDVEEAISGPFYLVKNGEINDGLDASYIAPRNSIGIKADGTVLLFLADGRQAPYSKGMSVLEIAQMMQAQGCVDALYLDGGGSATIASKHEGSSILKIQNSPSDGIERVVASALLIVSTETGSGIFDHTSITPNNEVYIQGSTIPFAAAAVDTAGFPTELPADVTWALADSSFGAIDAKTGVFTSNGKCGEVTVNSMRGGKVVGSTTVILQEPGELYFEAASLNLAFKAESDLGLTAKWQNRTMRLEGAALDWVITPKTEGKTPEDIGSISNNVFTAGKAKESLNADITVTYTKADGTKLTDTIAVEIGKMPQVFFDFEADENGELIKCGDYDWGDGTETWLDDSYTFNITGWDPETETQVQKDVTGPFTWDGWWIGDNGGRTTVPCSEIFRCAGYPLYTWRTSRMKRHAATAEVVSADDGAVRFGEHALKLNYDFTDLADGGRNMNMYLHYSGEDIIIDGTPSALGAWVYAPEGTPNYWIWTSAVSYYDETKGEYVDSNCHFITQEGRSIQYNGIYWEGWMYVEADLTPFAMYATPEHPLKIRSGHPLVMMTYIPGGSADENGDRRPMGAEAAGSIYFDNFRLVYGDTVDDLENPVISKISVNGKETKADSATEVAKSQITIDAEFMDPAGENATGINVAKTAILVDGVKQTLRTSTETAASAAVTLPNGSHSITVSVSDGFGNIVSDTRYITVSDNASTAGTVRVTGSDTATINESYKLQVTADNSDKISTVSAELKLTNPFSNPTVTFADGYTGTFTYEKGVLKLEATTAAPKTGAVADISFAVPAQTPKGSQFTYTVTKGSFTDNGTALTFAQAGATVTATAPYELSADVMVVGSSGRVYVTTADGKAPGRVEIYLVQESGEDILLGKTNTSGTLITNRLCQTVGEAFTIYAKGDKGLSFRYNGTTNGLGSDEVEPTNIRLNAVKDPATTQSITWFAAPQYTNDKPVVEYLPASEYSETGDNAFHSAAGTSKTQAFSENSAILLNTVRLTGLKPGTTYCYRVGDGVDGHWSDVQKFTTATADADTSFFVFGDTQLSGNPTADAEDIETMKTIAGAIRNTDADFGIQTGDFIDNAGSLAHWNEILGVTSAEYAELPTIQVLGNHEYMGNVSGDIAQGVFDLPGKDYYSVEYGNVYVAVINCNASLSDAANWLVEDAAKSDCEWKVLTVHQPAYYTNPKGSSASYNATIPPAAEAAGIDFVFSGHDHSYARTEPISKGAVDAENGVVYFICGDLGEKSRNNNYAAVNDPNFHFAKIDQTYDAIYLIAKTTGRTMTITVYDADGSVVDTYTKEHPTECDRNGHKYVYNRLTKHLSCSVCGEKDPNYTGFATDKTTGKTMYFLVGKYKTGWFVLDTDLYHFDERGLAHELTTIEDIPTDCAVKGHRTVRCECGETYTLEYSSPTGHNYQQATAEDGTVYYVCENCGIISKSDMPFVDVLDSDWFFDSVLYVYENEIFNGTGSIRFSPNQAMTRAQLVVVLHRLAGEPDDKNTTITDYTDCLSGSWYAAAVNWATKNGIVNGVGQNKFEPDGNITREQIVTMLYRYAKFAGKDTSKTVNFSGTFTDAAKVSSYARDAMGWAIASGILNGKTPTTICPADPAMRCQVATMAMRFLKLYEEEPAQRQAESEPAAESAPEEVTPVTEAEPETVQE